jgi:hypothetical protein
VADHFLYALPASDVFLIPPTVTVLAGTVDSAYPVANLWNLNPAKPFKATTTGIDLQFDFGAPVVIEFIALWHTNLSVVATVQNNTGTTWPGTVMGTLAVQARSFDGFRDNPMLDLRGQPARRYWRLTISGNATPVILGGLGMYNFLQTLNPWGPAIGLARPEEHPTVGFETDGRIEFRYSLGLRIEAFRSITVTVPRTTGLAKLKDLIRDAQGRARPFPVVIDPGSGIAQLVRFEDDELNVTGVSRDWVDVSMNLRDVGRGLAW